MNVNSAHTRHTREVKRAPRRAPVQRQRRPASSRRPEQTVRPNAAPRPAAPKRGIDPRWFTVGIIGAPILFVGVLAMIGALGLLYMMGNSRVVVPTRIPPTPTEVRYLPVNDLQLTAYDPIADETIDWFVPPDVWGEWISVPLSAPIPAFFPVPLDENDVRVYLAERQAGLGETRYFDLDEAVSTIQNAVMGGRGDALLRVYTRDRQHVVRSGETIISIAWDYGIPYPYIEQANPGVSSLSIGQTITVPSPDNLLPLPVVPGKRIVTSISEQRVRVYENGTLKWDWAASTGIDSSPTWTGVYQILSHEPNAYASNWNLWMPNFLGVYQPIPNADFTNGFHGFPTRGGSQLLWTNSLGTRVTYGCILLSNENIQLLYDWAEDGVIVEIQA